MSRSLHFKTLNKARRVLNGSTINTQLLWEELLIEWSKSFVTIIVSILIANSALNGLPQ